MSTDNQKSQAAGADTAEPSSNRALIWIIVLTAIVFLAIGCRDMDFTCDSVHYIDAARFLVEEYTYATEYLTLQAPQVPSVLSYWPPVYSAALAVPLAFGLSQNAAAWIVAVIGYGCGLYLLVYWLKRPGWVLLGTVCYIYIIFNSGLAFRALSEAVYIPLTIAALVFSAQAVGRADGRSQRGIAVAAGIAAGLSILTRYAGLALVPAIGLMAVVCILLDKDVQRRKERIINACLILAIAVCMTGMWLLRNYWMTGQLLGPERPPREYLASVVVLGFGAAFYKKFFPFLITFLFAAVGFHRLKSRDDKLRSDMTSSLAISSLLYVLFGVAGIIAAFLSAQTDQASEARQLVPVYIVLILGALALIWQMKPPSEVLRRRWYIIVPLALPIIVAPVVAGIASNPMQPRATEIDRWVQSETNPEDLLIGRRIWPVRFNTGRPVLDQTFVADPSVHDGEKVAHFLRRFGDEFTRLYLLAREKDPLPQIRASYRRAGLETEQIATVTTAPHHPQQSGRMQMVIYRVTFVTSEHSSSPSTAAH